MTKFIQKESNYIAYLTRNTNIDTSLIYNQTFFSIFPLSNLRIFKDLSYKPAEDKMEKQIIANSNASEEDKVINILGNEQIPNSYSELPLPVTKQNEDDIDTNSENDDMFYNNLSGYLTKYLPNVFPKNNEHPNGLKIVIQNDTQDPIYTWNEYVLGLNKNNLYAISNVPITYDILYVILRDMYIQIDYLKNAGYFFTKLDKNNLLRVQNRFIYLDGKNIDIYENKNDINNQINKCFVDFVRDLLMLDDDTEIVEQMKKIQHTQIYYFIKRVEREGTLLWL